MDISYLEVKESNVKGAGRGIFTKKSLKKYSIVEKSNLIVLSIPDVIETPLKDYIFLHPYNPKKCFIALGYGSLYNHCDEPNVHYYYDKDEKVLVFECKRDIEEGEELYIFYGANWWKKR